MENRNPKQRANTTARVIEDSPIHCYCGKKARIMTSWTNLNPGIRFLGCNKHKVIMY